MKHDIGKRIFKIDISSPQPQGGSLLVAEPFLRESYFNHAVIALIEHGDTDGTMGVVLNRDSGHTLDELLDDVKREDVTVYCGGPMSGDRLYFLHTLGSDILPGAREIANGLWIGGDYDAMVSYIEAGYPVDGHIRFFIGYSGWEAGQLSRELRDNVWAVAEFSNAPALLTDSEDAVWHRAVRHLGSEFRGWQYHPRDPRAN